jgi:hypothetical protein
VIPPLKVTLTGEDDLSAWATMSLKRIPPDDEIDALAARFRALWVAGDVIRPWLRRHAEMLLALVQDGWSWSAIARALTQAGITYRTGRAWSANNLQSEAYRARKPLRGYARKSDAPDPAAVSATVPAALVAANEHVVQPPGSSPGWVPHDDRASQASPTGIIPQPAPAVPRFRPASFRVGGPPRPLSEAERAEIERNRRLTFGPSASKE